MDQVQEIKSKINIVDVVNESVRLKKAGRNFQGLCPFHSEKTPSFSVSPEMQIFKCFGCFPAGQFVKTPLGSREIQNISTGEYVYSGKGNLQKVEIVYERDYEGDLVSLSLGSLTEEISLTGDHNVYVVGGSNLYKNNYKYLSRKLNKHKKYKDKKRLEKLWGYHPIEKIEARGLKPKMSLLYPIDETVRDVSSLDISEYVTKRWPKHGAKPVSPKLDIPVNDAFLKILGYYIAEGSTHRAYVRFSLGNHEKEFAQEIAELFKKTFNVDAAIHNRRKGRNGIEVTACNSILANVFENLCGKGAENKHIPFVLQQLPVKKQQVLLQAIFKGDGHFVKNERKFITTISRTLADQATDILLRLGFFPSKNFQKAKIDKKGVSHKNVFKVNWAISKSASRRKHIYEDSSGSKYWILPVIKTKTSRFKGKVYNLRVANDNSYVSGNFAVSNCGEAGDVITFLEKTEGLEFIDVLKLLADRAGVKLKKFDNTESRNRDLLKQINEDATRFYHYILLEHSRGKKALEYLKKRGLKTSTIKTFKLGFATQDKSLMSNNLIKKQKYTAMQLEEAGLSYARYGKAVDRFRGRIIFPIADLQGKVIALAGRILPELSGSGLAKYINSPETKIYYKSRSLFGLDKAKQYIKKQDYVVLTEGEMDFLSSWQADVKNVVAIKGTALTAEHITILSRFTKNITLALDSDFAGDNAALKGIAMAQNADMRIKSADLGKFKDPDEFASADSAGYKKQVEEAKDVWEFLIEKLDERYDLDTASGKSDASNLLIPLLSQIENEIVREHYLQKLAQKLSVSAGSVNKQSSKFAVKNKEETKLVVEKKQDKLREQKLEEELLVMLLRFYPNALLKKDLLIQVNMRFTRRIIKILKDYFNSSEKTFDIKSFSEELPNELKVRFSELVLEYSQDPKSSRDYVNELFEYLVEANIKEKRQKIIVEMTEEERKGNEERVSELQILFKKLEQTQKTSIIEQDE